MFCCPNCGSWITELSVTIIPHGNKPDGAKYVTECRSCKTPVRIEVTVIEDMFLCW